MAAYFFYGTLMHPPLRAVVLGRDVSGESARLPGHRISGVRGEHFPMLIAERSGNVPGVLVRDLSRYDVARMDFYQCRFPVAAVSVLAADGAFVPARVFVAPDWLYKADGPWSLAAWLSAWGDLVVTAARDMMTAYGTRDPEDVARRTPQILVRAAARIRARETAPVTLRHAAAPGDVQVADRREPYAHFFAVEEYDLSFRRFDGTPSRVVNRAVFVSGDAATVLPYDPVRDRVLLVEQFRPGPYARGDGQPWVLEPIAGRVDPGETPQTAARREAQEEAGVAVGALHEVAQYYPSPGAKTEYIYSYVGLADLPDGSAGTGGLDTEGEDIRSHLVPFDRLMALVASGEAQCGPLILTALWLAANRDRLRSEAAALRPVVPPPATTLSAQIAPHPAATRPEAEG